MLRCTYVPQLKENKSDVKEKNESIEFVYKGLTPNPPDEFVGAETVKRRNNVPMQYIPLIKNVISDRELMWTDDGKTSEWTKNTMGSYLEGGRSNVIPYPWSNQVKSWNEIGEGTDILYLYASDSTIMWFDALDYERPQYIGWKSATACCVMTSKKMIFFKSKDTGIRILLRLIDDRIGNALGPNSCRVVAYPVRSDIIIGAQSNWWQNWSDITGNLGVQVEKSEAYLMYRHTLVHKKGKLPVICTPEPDPYIHASVPFKWSDYDPFNPNTFV